MVADHNATNGAPERRIISATAEPAVKARVNGGGQLPPPNNVGRRRDILLRVDNFGNLHMAIA
jgi:hypothetical protein